MRRLRSRRTSFVSFVSFRVIVSTLALDYSKSFASVAGWRTGVSSRTTGGCCCASRDDPGVRLRDIAATLDITERSAYAIVSDRARRGYAPKEKDGRRNRYIVQHHLPLPETDDSARTVGEVLDLLVGTNDHRGTTAAKKPAKKTVKRTTKKTTRTGRVADKRR